jgi:diaminopimelate epimerase
MQFTKYHGSGNDFILIDNRQNHWSAFVTQHQNQSIISDHLPNNNKTYSKENSTVYELCHRNFGIGADGLMLLQPSEIADFEMVYFNSDGHLSSMCGNGGRCIAHFAAKLGLGKEKNGKTELTFTAPDGLHHATVDIQKNWVQLTMNPVSEIHRSTNFPNAWVLNTGSPHFVEFSTSETAMRLENDVNAFVQWGRNVRYNEEFSKSGINVNLVSELEPQHISIRTYERGVENETLSCGTGITAAAIAYQQENNLKVLNTTAETQPTLIRVKSRGGNLTVHFNRSEEGFDSIVLSGPVIAVFTGEQ